MAKGSQREGVLYILRAEGVDAVKVGFTSLPLPKRMRDLQTGCPHKLSLVASRRGTKAEELALHRSMAEYRIRGEWFDLNGVPVAHLVENASNGVSN